MQDIADVYDEIVATDQQLGTNHLQGLLETLAGKNRANIAASIIQNGDMLRSVYQDSQDSEGSALEENDKYLESISGHIDQLKNKWQELWADSANREQVNFFIDLAKAALDFLDVIGLIPTVLATIGTFLSLSHWEKVSDFIKNLDRPKTWSQLIFIIKWVYYYKGIYIMA